MWWDSYRGNKRIVELLHVRTDEGVTLGNTALDMGVTY